MEGPHTVVHNTNSKDEFDTLDEGAPKKKQKKGSTVTQPTPSPSQTKTKTDYVRYHCNYCGKDISNVVRVKCAVCSDFDLCVECFAVGVQIGPHKSFHDYHVMDALNFPLFHEAWGADEELLLLEGIEIYGLGNWGDVSDHVGTKPGVSCKDHYFKTYINVPTAPYPDLTKCLTTSESLQERNRHGKGAMVKVEDMSVLEEDDEITAKRQSHTKQSSNYSVPELAGYMTLRGDFETEYENDAETVICDLIFGDDDTPVERDLKLRILEMYNQKLDERAKRKAFLIDRNLLEYKKEKEKKKTREEKEKEKEKDREQKETKDLQEKLKVFGRLLSKEEHEDFVNGLILEKKLRQRIKDLKRYRSLGIHTVAETEEYEVDKKRRDAEAPLPSKRSLSASFAERERLTVRKWGSGSSSSVTGVSGRSTNELNQSGTNNGSSNNSSGLFRLEDRKKQRKSGTHSHSHFTLDISTSPSYELLSEKEKELCSSIRLYPQQYIIIKDTLLRETIKHGVLRKAEARQLIKIDVNKTGRIFDFFEQCGWINKDIQLPKDSNTSSNGSTVAITVPPLYQYNFSNNHNSTNTNTISLNQQNLPLNMSAFSHSGQPDLLKVFN